MEKSKMLDEIKSYLNIAKGKEFAAFLGIKPSTLSMWYKRNTFDTDLIFKKCDFLNPEWLLTGKGSMLKENNSNVATTITTSTTPLTNQEDTISERIKRIIDHYGISVRAFEKSIGASNNSIQTTIKRKSDVKTGTINKILQVYKEISQEWLLTGKGSMLKENKDVSILEKPSLVGYSNGTTATNTGAIPLVSQTAVAGFGNSNFSISEQDVKEYYVVPKFKHNRVDFMVEVRGNSMYPKYNSGDVIACTILKESTFIQWNKPHLIATREQGLLVKRILPAKEKEYIILKSDNKDYPEFEVPKKEITGIAIVVGVIRLE